MTEFMLSYHVKRKVSFQARDIKHAKSLAKSVVNTIHRGIKDNEYVILGIETCERNTDKEKADAPDETTGSSE